MGNAGGAWDNSKTYIEGWCQRSRRRSQGRGVTNFSRFRHIIPRPQQMLSMCRSPECLCIQAAVVGDTVGDPCKDTCGPALNILIKLMSIISLVVAPALARAAS